MFLRIMWVLLILSTMAIGCSEKEKHKTNKQVGAPADFESVLKESKGLLSLIKKGVLIIGQSNIEAHILANGLSLEKNSFRSEIVFGEITLKKVFKCEKNIISGVHYDFYYDSLNMNISKNSNSILRYLKNELGDYNHTHKSKTMKVYSWKLASNTLDYELFRTGFTFTLRKNEKPDLPVVIEEILPIQLKLVDLLIGSIHGRSIALESSTILDVENLFNVSFKRKSTALAFSKTYNGNKLLSGSFLFEDGVLSGAYFDYMYSGDTSKELVSDAASIRGVISRLFGSPSEVATAVFSTSYKWPNTSIVLEIYADGFSVVLE